jgi:hypothetical protein
MLPFLSDSSYSSTTASLRYITLLCLTPFICLHILIILVFLRVPLYLVFLFIFFISSLPFFSQLLLSLSYTFNIF